MDIKFASPRHIHQPVDSVKVETVTIMVDQKQIMYTVSSGGPMGNIVRRVTCPDDILAKIEQIVSSDANANVGVAPAPKPAAK